MEIKTEQRVVEYNKYVTKDGAEFDDYEAAEKHEAVLMGTDIFGVTKEEIENVNQLYVVVRSAKDVDAFVNFAEACDISCSPEFWYENFCYPAVFCFDERGDFKNVSTEEYERAKRIVSLFETLKSE